MDRQSLSKHEREQKASEALASQLDQLSVPLAERILGRAIELQSEAAEEAHTTSSNLTYDQLTEIAEEVGIPERALKRAILEELDTDTDHGATPIERLTIPNTIRGGIIVDADVDEIQRRLTEFFEHEGYELDERLDGFSSWRKGGPYGRRSIESFTISQQGDRKLVEVDVDTAEQRARAVRIGLLIFLALLVIGPFGLGALALVGVAVAGGFGGFVSALKRFAGLARRRINRALRTLVDEMDKGEHWLDVFEESVEALFEDDDDEDHDDDDD